MARPRDSAGAPGLEHLERPDYADEMALVRAQRDRLVEATLTLAVGVRLWVTLLGSAVLLSRLDPVLALLPLFGLGRAVTGRKALALRLRVEQETAAPGRLREHLFALATSPGPAPEVRVFELGDELAARHRAVSRQVAAAWARHVGQRAALEIAGSLCFAVGYVGALERAGAADVAAALPKGLETQLGPSWEGGVELSGGQWQKLALARALMREAPLLTVFDEPTAALDAPTEHALFERLDATARSEASRGAVTLLVSHRFFTVRMADLIVVLDGGRVREMGSHAELMAAGGLYAELYTLQARAYRAPAASASPPSSHE
jgi:ABC-type cobalamin transport system ATPase subunit